MPTGDSAGREHSIGAGDAGDTANDDYAIIAGPQVAKSLIIQLHADATFHTNPLPSLLPEPGQGRARGAGAEFRLFDMDPDAAARRVEVAGWCILQPPTDKPHGCASAICWILKAIAGCPAV